MTSRLRCLVQATPKRTTTFHHPSSAAQLHNPKASVDRYTTIRSFFSHNHRQPTQLHENTLTRSLPEASGSSQNRNAGHHGPRTFWSNSSTRQLHTTSILWKSSSNRRSSGPHTNHDDIPSPHSSSSQANTPQAPPSPPPEKPPNLENYSEFFRRLALSLPGLHRPTKDDFLNVASGFWQRARIRFKWFTIKSFRKFNADDISAFITVLLMSQTLWVLVGTTTFLSVVFATINSLRLQEYVARAISDYLTSETGVTIIFESAIVPKWKDSRISFKNVYISRRPASASRPPSKGDIGHRAAAGYDVANHPSFFHHEDDHEHEHEGSSAIPEPEDDIEGDGYSMFDLTIDSVDVTLSLWRWLDGRGMIEDAVVKGVRGVLDRRSVIWEPGLEPALFRHPARVGDFQLDSLQLEDVLITVHQPGGFRPFTASIFHANIGAFRKNFLFYDFLHAESVVGQFDGCLFSLHRPQSIGRTHEMDLREGDRSRMTRIRIDGVNIDHLQGSTTSASGPVSWITSGKVDAVLDITFPRDPSAPALNEILGEIADSITSSLALDIVPGQRELAKPALSAPEDNSQHHSHSTDEAGESELRKEKPVQPEPKQKVLVDIDIRFRDLKAAVPIFPGELSYVNSALIRPIVAFINANRVLVPIHCRVVKDLSDFEGAWTMWEAGLTDDISLQIYEALAYHVSQINMNRRIKTVSVWSLHLTANALVSALRNAMDPVTAHLRELYARDYESALRAGMASFAQ